MAEDVAQTGQAARWYAIQTYSGHEKKVKTLLERKIADLPGEPEEKVIREVIVPTREVVEIKGGKKIRTTKRLYPGYVLVNMVLNQETMFLVNSVQSVIKFLGGGSQPQPLQPDTGSMWQPVTCAAAAPEPWSCWCQILAIRSSRKSLPASKRPCRARV